VDCKRRQALAQLQPSPVQTAAQSQRPAGTVHNGKAYYFKIVAQQDGTFTITNMRNNFSKTYRPGVANATR